MTQQLTLNVAGLSQTEVDATTKHLGELRRVRMRLRLSVQRIEDSPAMTAMLGDLDQAIGRATRALIGGDGAA